METCQCSDCGKHLSVNSIRRHKKKSCKGNDMKTVQSSKPSIEKYQQQPNDLRLSSFSDSIISEKPKTIKKNPQLSAFANAIINDDDKSKKHTVDGMQPQGMFIPKRDMIGPSSDEEESMMLPLKKRKRLL